MSILINNKDLQHSQHSTVDCISTLQVKKEKKITQEARPRNEVFTLTLQL